jgi:choline-sulfatase
MAEMLVNRAPRMGGAICLVLLIVLLGCGTNDETEFDPRPNGTLEDVAHLSERDDLNVIFILIDTLRSDRLGIYGYERNTSPVLDYFAQTGLHFSQHSSQSSWTKTSMASLWTSLYPVRNGVLRHPHVVSEEAVMPAEVFKEAGYATAGIWRNGWVAPNFGFRQGFDIYQLPRPRQAPEELLLDPGAGRIEGTDIDAIFSGIDFLQANQDRRFFLYLHLMDIHQYVSSEETALFGTTYSDTYDNAIRWTDTQLGLLYAELFRLGMGDRTLVVVVADHGEAFGEHGSEGHARDVHHEVVSTPFLINFPFKLDPGIQISHPTQNVDVWPTVLDMVGLPLPEVSDGQSRLDWMIGDRVGDTEVVGFAQLDRGWSKPIEDSKALVGVREGDFRLIYNADDSSLDRLYDLRTDPGELEDVSAQFGDILGRLRQRAEAYLKQSTPWTGGAPEIKIDEMRLRQLRALGYSIED